MAAKVGLVSLTQHQKLLQFQQQQQNPDSTTTNWMWNPNQVSEELEDDSWEVRAFEQDSGNITWPPRSYTCTFCRREFRSAQALGGHMNVHRRDRARLHHKTPTNNSPTTAASSSSNPSALLIPAQEIVVNGGLCVLYSLPNPNSHVLNPNRVNSCMDSPSTLLTISQFEANNNLIPPSTYTYPITPQSINSSFCQYSSNNTEPSASNSSYINNNRDNGEIKKDLAVEEIDLELRLGRR